MTQCPGIEAVIASELNLGNQPELGFRPGFADMNMHRLARVVGSNAGRGIDPVNNVANSRLKWGLRLARACLAPGFAGDVGVTITLVIDVAADGEPQS